MKLFVLSPFDVCIVFVRRCTAESQPDVSNLELCSICSEAVLDDHTAVCCDLCDSWVHVSCDPSSCDDLYANMVQESSTDP